VVRTVVARYVAEKVAELRVPAGAGHGGHDERRISPDLDLLEFLGTFAEDGKKDIDPMDLADLPGDEKTPPQSPPKKSVEGKEKKEEKGNQRCKAPLDGESWS
jgi:hypothetical protein